MSTILWRRAVARFATRYVVAESGCWVWAGSKSADGYGKFSVGTKDWRAHRFSWTSRRGPIPDGQLVLHSCDNPPCVNPDHLFLGSQLDNRADCSAKGRAATGPENGARLYPERLARGERQGLAKLTAAQVGDIRARYRTGQYRQTDLSAIFGISPATVAQIVTLKTWRHVS